MYRFGDPKNAADYDFANFFDADFVVLLVNAVGFLDIPLHSRACFLVCAIFTM